jgi:tetrapyrrole methylase family protein/MazG family protein
MVDFEYKDSYTIEDYRKIMALLRSKDGCPWDREQDHHSIRRNLLEEAYEVCEAIDEEDPEHLKEELGDLLMQVLFHTQIEEEQGRFNLDDVSDGACKKLILRHPHVFGTVEVQNSNEVLTNWDEIKRKEKAQTTVSKTMADVAETLPALWRAEKVQKKAAKVGFDWPSVQGTMMKIREETDELQQAIDHADRVNMEEEIGDLLFSAVNASRLLGIDPEEMLHRACEKFIRRFTYLEEHALADGKALQDLSLEEMETYYQQGRKELEGKEISNDFQTLSEK